MPKLPSQPPPHQPPRPPQFRPPQRKNSLGYVLLFALILTIAYYVFNPQGVQEDKRATEILLDALAGLEMGGIPIATVLSLKTGIRALFVRKKAKEYGTCKLAEGGEVAGQRLLIIEDVVTSGGAILDAVRELRKLGAIVDEMEDFIKGLI